jgi:hypothetical protein
MNSITYEFAKPKKTFFVLKKYLPFFYMLLVVIITLLDQTLLIDFLKTHLFDYQFVLVTLVMVSLLMDMAAWGYLFVFAFL